VVTPGVQRPRAVVIGPPGAGKSTVARRLADRLGVAWHDTDESIEQAQGRSISDIFVEEGEAFFATSSAPRCPAR